MQREVLAVRAATPISSFLAAALLVALTTTASVANAAQAQVNSKVPAVP